jgi:hypothetical protein
MKTLFGSFLAVIAGIALALVLVVGVEFFSSIVHPLPANFETQAASIQRPALD